MPSPLLSDFVNLDSPSAFWLALIGVVFLADFLKEPTLCVVDFLYCSLLPAVFISSLSLCSAFYPS